jgi:uncharacterized repeat protein (TIGR01451 family)
MRTTHRHQLRLLVPLLGAFGFSMACSTGSRDDIGRSSSAVSAVDASVDGSSTDASSSSLTLYDFVPPTGYVGVPTSISGEPYDLDGSVHNDVTLTMTVTGDFAPGQLGFWGYDPWSCADDVSTPGIVTITCHTDTFQYKDQVGLDLTPNSAGTISVDVHLTERGVEVASDHQTMAITVATGADLGIFSFPGRGGVADVLLGQSVDVQYGAYNNGPLPATGAHVDFSLSGPGKLLSVGAPWWVWPPPTCSFTDTTATCAIGAFGVYASSAFDVVFQGTDVGQVTLTGKIAGDQADPVPSNDSDTSIFNVLKPRVADLAITMTDAPDPILFKKPLTYTITVSNKGPDGASDALVYDALPSDLTFGSVTSSQGSCTGGSGFLGCELGPMAAGSSATIKLIVTPTEGGSITNYVSVFDPTPTDIDPDWSNNSATATTTVRGPNPPVITTSYDQRQETFAFAYVPCADDFVTLQGMLHISSHTVYNKSSGRAQFDSLANPQGITGVGLNTGTKYQATGMTRSAQTFVGYLPKSFDYQDNFRLLGKGAGKDLLIHALEHVTVLPDGTPKIVTKYSFECK